MTHLRSQEKVCEMQAESPRGVEDGVRGADPASGEDRPCGP